MSKHWKHIVVGYLGIGGAYTAWRVYKGQASTDALSLAKSVALWPAVMAGF